MELPDSGQAPMGLFSDSFWMTKSPVLCAAQAVTASLDKTQLEAGRETWPPIPGFPPLTAE